MRDADPDLIAARVGRLVAEEDQVEVDACGSFRFDRLQDRGSGGLRVPVLAARREMDRPVDAERHRVAELLLGFGRPEREDDRLAAVLLDEPHRLLDAALLVRADGEAEVLRSRSPARPG